MLSGNQMKKTLKYKCTKKNAPVGVALFSSYAEISLPENDSKKPNNVNHGSKVSKWIFKIPF